MLVKPYGGQLADLAAPAEALSELLREARLLPRVVMGPRALCDFELLSNGAFSPLDGFMNRTDYEGVLRDMRLESRLLWPIPITLPIDVHVQQGGRVALAHPRGDVLGVMTVTDVYEIDPMAEAIALLGRCDETHPYTSEILRGPKRRIGGRVTALASVPHFDFTAERLAPQEVRRRLVELGRDRVVAFQTRNPLHRSHEELMRRAMQIFDATLLLHPAVGMTQPGDVDHFSRVRGYRAVLGRYFEPGSAVLALLPVAMRMAGPREAVWHGIIRRNYGASHFIVGRDHAGPTPDSSGRPYFAPQDAQELFKKHQDEIGVTMASFDEMVYVESELRYEERSKVNPGARVLALSGTQVRDEYLAKGRALPEWFTRPEVARLLASSAKRGVCVWLTGLSGSGKTVTAEALRAILAELGAVITLLDGDEVRLHLSKGLGFSREDRDTNILRIGYVASEVVRHGGIVVCAAISPYRAARDGARRLVEATGGVGSFVEVFVDTTLAVCESRDVKGLYAKARAGELKGFTGIDDPYEAPGAADVHLSGVDATPVDNARAIVAVLEARNRLIVASEDRVE